MMGYERGLLSKKSLIDTGAHEISISKQCKLIGISRASLYYKPKPTSGVNLQILNTMDKIYQKTYLLDSAKVGDTHLDINAAKAANISHIGVYSGYETKESLEKITPFVEKDALHAVMLIQKFCK